jgi:hypothetical protein
MRASSSRANPKMYDPVTLKPIDLDRKMEEGRAARERRRQEHVTQDLQL